jgi:hypothetical protein
VLGLAGLSALLAMTIANLPLLVGGSGTLAAIVGVLLAGAFAGGTAVAVLRPDAARHHHHSGGVAPAATTETEIDKEIAR